MVLKKYLNTYCLFLSYQNAQKGKGKGECGEAPTKKTR